MLEAKNMLFDDMGTRFAGDVIVSFLLSADVSSHETL